MKSDIKIKVSVLIITYNQSRFIEKAIKSALLQKTTFKYEIIVMDDSSKDGTLNIANKYREKYPDQIKVFSNINNLGITKNYKEGFKKCTGEYIAILEGDDYWISRRKLQLESDFLDRHTGYSAVFNRFVVYNTIYNTKQTQAWNNSFSYETITTKKLTLGNVIGNFSACMYRKVCVNKLKASLYDMVVYDWMFNIAISEKGPIAYLPQICSVYRVHSKGKWSGKSERSKILMTLKLIDKYNKFLGFKYDNNFKIVKKVIYNELIKS